MVDYSKAGRNCRVRTRGVVMACWNSVSSYVVPELPAEQVAAMRYGTKVALVHARVALRGRRGFARARVSRVGTPSKFLSGFGLPTSTGIGIGIGDFTMPHRPELPAVVSL